MRGSGQDPSRLLLLGEQAEGTLVTASDRTVAMTQGYRNRPRTSVAASGHRERDRTRERERERERERHFTVYCSW